MAWYEVVLLSYPGQAGTDHLMILPAAEEDTPTETADLPQEGAELSIVLEGDMVLPVTGKYENGVATVPVAAVAQALGYEVTYTPAERPEDTLVTVESDTFRVELRFQVPTIIGVTKIEGAVGMTPPWTTAWPPMRWPPAPPGRPPSFLRCWGRTVTLDKDTISIQ